MAGRIEHIDSIRALAVLLMVMVHAAATWGPPSSTQPSALVYAVSGLGGLAAPLFVTVFGWGCFRSSTTGSQRVKRAVFFILAQTAINISAPHLFEVFSPGVLTLFGLLILTQPLWLDPMTRAPQRSNAVFFTALTGVMMVTLLFSSIQGPSTWDARNETNSMLQWIKHALFSGTYPLFPWVIFATLGAFISSQGDDNKTFPQTNYALSMVFAGCLVCAFSFAYAAHHGVQWAAPTGPALLTFFPANTLFLVAAMTGVSLLWLLAQHISMNVLNPLGQRSLSVYLIHFIPIGLFHGLNESYAFTMSQSMMMVLAYTSVWLPFAHAWSRLAPRMDVEHALRFLTK